MPVAGAQVQVGTVGPSLNASVRSLKVGTTVGSLANGVVSLPANGTIYFDPTNFVAGLYGSPFHAGAPTIVSGNNAAGSHLFDVSDSGLNNPAFAVISQGANKGGVATAPLASAAPTGGNLTLGTAWQNTNAWDVTLVVYLAITANTSLVISLGVGPTNTPVQQTIITGTTALGVVAIPIRVPAGYYALLSSAGVGTDALVGQIMYNN